MSDFSAAEGLAIARAVALVIGADLRASDAERAAYEALLTRLGLDTEAAHRALGFLTARPSLEEVAAGLVGERVKRAALEEALAAAHADDRFSSAELETIERLASAVGIPAGELSAIETVAIARAGIPTLRNG